jgi:hypothetical protein
MIDSGDEMELLYSLLLATALFVVCSLSVAAWLTIRDWFRYRSAPRRYVSPGPRL